ncbi:MAG: RimK/LysX family protein [Candidatus Saccharimonadales bacterium]
MSTQELSIIGRNVSVDFVGHSNDIPAKIDTGADSSAVWASDITVDEGGVLHFYLFAKQSPFYTGKMISTDAYKVTAVRSSSGHREIRYRVTMSVRINGRRVNLKINLADRSKQKFPVLIGRRSLAGKFLVDVSKAYYRDDLKAVTMETDTLNDQLYADRYGFHIKYFVNKTE